ncbi:MAG: glycerophosphodiester phosphodiesterase [Deltaproteobacteria bacterium]|nr:glycerophosphodiester phosphodiesterase [Deltaproteobacteria bacterium]
MIVTSHRGAGFLEPENTLRAIRRAIELGADQVELDVQLTRDGHLILMHDETVDRTTNGQGKISELTLVEIRRLDAGQGELVPTLEEVLALTDGKITPQIELKGPATAAAVVRTVEAVGRADNVIVTSFLHQQLIEARQLNAQLQTGALWGRLPIDVVPQSQRLGVGALHIWHEFIDEKLVSEAHARGLLVRAWNANKEEDMQRLIGLGVDAIGSDRPDLLLGVCRWAGVR